MDQKRATKMMNSTTKKINIINLIKQRQRNKKTSK